MNSSILFLGAGFLLGNTKAREQVFSYIQKMAGSGIDFLNGMNGRQSQGDANAESDKSN